MVEPGIFYVHPDKWYVGEWPSEKKTPYLRIEFTVTHKEVDGQWVDYDSPETGWLDFFLSTGAFPISVEQLKSIGFNGDFGSPDFTDETKNGLRLQCKEEEYNGKIRERWSLPSSFQRIDANRSEIMRLNQLYKQATGGTAPKRPTPPTSAKGGNGTQKPKPAAKPAVPFDDEPAELAPDPDVPQTMAEVEANLKF